MITSTQFRWLLATYALVVILTVASDFWTGSAIPIEVQQLENALPTQSMPLLLLLLAFLVSVVLAGLVGFIGLFCLWSPARYIFLVGVLFKIVSLPLLASWTVTTGWESLFGELELLLDGVILTLCILGPAKELFLKKHNSIKTH